MLSFRINRKSLDEVTNRFKELDAKIERKALRRAGIEWATLLMQQIKSNITWDETQLQSKLDFKIQRLKKKRGYWIGVGIAAGEQVSIERGKQTINAATKARWYEGGYHAYPKGLPSGKTGKGWRKGLRGRKGSLVYNTGFISKAYAPAQKSLLPIVEQAIKKALEG